MKNKQRGFTLIELLVVVLIIGILAAVALPQYQFAVYKARFAKVYPLFRSVQEAQKRYYMENGTWPSLEDMDIGISCQTWSDDKYSCRNEGWMWGISVTRDGKAQLSLRRANTDAVDDMRLIETVNSQKWHDTPKWQCLAPTSLGENSLSNRLCKSLGGVLTKTNSGNGCNGGQGCNVYKLP